MLYTLRFFFSSKCSLFHNANLFGSCIIHILCTVCAEIKKNNSGAEGLKLYFVVVFTGKTKTLRSLNTEQKRHGIQYTRSSASYLVRGWLLIYILLLTKKKVQLSLVHAMTTYGGSGIKLY